MTHDVTAPKNSSGSRHPFGRYPAATWQAGNVQHTAEFLRDYAPVSDYAPDTRYRAAIERKFTHVIFDGTLTAVAGLRDADS